MPTLTFSDTLTVVECYNCGITFGMPEQYDRLRRSDHGWWYCPNGHQQHYNGKNEAEKLREQLQIAEKRLANARDDVRAERMSHDGTKNSLRSTRGELTKTRKRAEKGVCIHCNRHFVDVARHMTSQHAQEVLA